jgi:hypothetical protein
VLLIIAIVGTTVAPWQLFFQQSNIIDKRITPRWINYERLDTCDRRVRRRDRRRRADRRLRVRLPRAPATSATSPTRAHRATGLKQTLGSTLGAFFALVLLNASLIGAARGDALDELRLRRRVRHQELAAPQLPRRKVFYAIFAAWSRARPRSC